MASRSGLSLSASVLLLLCPALTRADKIQVTSNPPGAKVELEEKSGTTPFEQDFPGSYFHAPMSLLSRRLSHPLVARITLAGYAKQEITLTEGPMEWVSLTGHKRYKYWLIKSKSFHVDLSAVVETFTGTVTARVGEDKAVELGPELSQEQLTSRAKPAVVYLKSREKTGSGFFVTDTGVIATNAHLARGETTLFTLLSSGQKLEAKVVYIDPDLDIALAKVPGTNFPHLALADAATVRQGESVLAIGCPGDAMPFSVTRGIVSAVGKFPNAGPGTWIQTDASINPGNSGGPLLNVHGEVIGINTQKLVKENVTGIGFALSSSDLLDVLHRFYPSATTHTAKLSSPVRLADSAASTVPADGFGTVVLSKPEGSEIWIDNTFVGMIPATLKLSAERHLIVVKFHGHADWIRFIQVLKDSQVNLNPDPQ
jgi:S1-C subfamily serine protease